MSPFVAYVLAHFAADPVVSLERRDPPTHLVVRAVYRSAADGAVVAFDLIDAPPPPSTVDYGGVFFEAEPRAGAWWIFAPSLPIEENIARMRDHVRDAIAICGRAGKPPRAAVEPPPLEGEARPKRFEVARPAPRPPEPPPPALDPFTPPGPTARKEPAPSPAPKIPRRPPSAPPPRESTSAPTTKIPRAAFPPEPPPPPSPERGSAPGSGPGEASPRPSGSVPPPPFERTSGPPEPPPPRPLFRDEDR